MKQIIVAMMVKNEASNPRLIDTLKSIKKLSPLLAVLDTGSRDSTVRVISKWCEENSLALEILPSTVFKDFSTSRNLMLDYIYSLLSDTWILLMDAGDVLNCSEPFEFDDSYDAYQLTQHWECWDGTSMKFKNIRLVKNKNRYFGYRYKGLVHEYLEMEKSNVGARVGWCPWTLEQTRLESDNKRLPRDLDMLCRDVNARALFYMGQTLAVLGNHDVAKQMYSTCALISQSAEERWMCHFRIAGLETDRDKKINALMCCLQENRIRRSEPFELLAELIPEARDLYLSFVRRLENQQLTDMAWS